VWWDLRSDRSTEFALRTRRSTRRMFRWDGGWRKPPALGRMAVLALPGTYTVTLNVGEEKFTQKLTVLKDPHTAARGSTFKRQTREQQRFTTRLNAMAATVNKIESLRAQVVALGKELGHRRHSKPVRKATDDLGEKLAGIEGTLLQLKLTGRGQDDCRWSPMLLQKVNYLFNPARGQSDFPLPRSRSLRAGRVEGAGRQSGAGLSAVDGERPGAVQRPAAEH